MVTGMDQHVGCLRPPPGPGQPHPGLLGAPQTAELWWSMGMVNGGRKGRKEAHRDSLLCAKSSWQRLQVQHMVLRISGTNEKA